MRRGLLIDETEARPAMTFPRLAIVQLLVLTAFARPVTAAETPPRDKDIKSAKAAITIPADARPGDEFHLICEVTDHGSPPLARYRRVVVRVPAR